MLRDRMRRKYLRKSKNGGLHWAGVSTGQASRSSQAEAGHLPPVQGRPELQSWTKSHLTSKKKELSVY